MLPNSSAGELDAWFIRETQMNWGATMRYHFEAASRAGIASRGATLMLCMLLVSALCIVSTTQSAEHAAPSLGAVLDDDGRLQPDVNGSFDAQGFYLTTDSTGAPRFHPEQSSTTAECADRWDDRFFLQGVSDGTTPQCSACAPVVRAIAVNGTDVYVAGTFRLAGGQVVNNVARWDGNAWSALGAGTDGPVHALLFTGGQLYVGGGFQTAGGATVNRIARWDGSGWSALAGGVDGTVNAIAGADGAIYMGGSFKIAGSVTANNVARWDGSTWSAVGEGLGRPGIDAVRALAVSGSDVYAGGSFASTGAGISANNVARWNGVDWSALGSGVNSNVNSIAIAAGGDVYVGGRFTSAGTIAANRIARWDGAAWSPLDAGATGVPTVDSVLSVALLGSDVYIGGTFTAASGVVVNRIARWNGTAWSALDTGTSGSVSAITVVGTELYAGGTFTRAGSAAVNNVARWNGASWAGIDHGAGEAPNGFVSAIAVAGSDVYVAGAFSAMGDFFASGVARWDGNAWHALGTGIPRSPAVHAVSAIAVSGSNVYVGGVFTNAGGVSVNNIACWNGESWSAMGGGVNGAVEVLRVSGTDLYVGGSFRNAGGQVVNNIAKWDGNSWSALGGGVTRSDGLGPDVYAIAISPDAIFVGGDFTHAGGTLVNNIARWRDGQWSALGDGVHSSFVLAIGVRAGTVYAGGLFTLAGSTTRPGIAQWDGANWSPVGGGVTGHVNDIAIRGNHLFAGGVFDSAGGVPSRNLARWDGTAWSALESGVDKRVDAIAIAGGDIYIGGAFTFAGCRVSEHFARLRGAEVRLTSITKATDRIMMQGVGEPGATYRIEASGDLRSGFVEVGASTAGDDGLFGYEEQIGAAVLQRFYRVPR